VTICLPVLPSVGVISHVIQGVLMVQVRSLRNRYVATLPVEDLSVDVAPGSVTACPGAERRGQVNLGGVRAVIQLENVTCRFGDPVRGVLALSDVSLEIMSASFVAVMGATGSGKSTLLNCASALERPTSGAVRLLGNNVAKMSESEVSRVRRSHVGFVFQSYNLFSELTVSQNVLMPTRLGARRARTVCDVLDAVGLGGAEQRTVGGLSGGQRQRVAVARALVTAPSVIFADEPTGALDPASGAQILTLLRRAVDEQGCTVVMVTHDPLAAAFSDRLVLLRTGEIVDDRQTPDASSIGEQLRQVSTTPAPVAS